jgi:predicted HicB family RNase H-like nuclease
MYTLQYRFRQQSNSRLTKWFKVSQHVYLEEARQALSQHIAEFSTFNARLITNDGDTLGEYKYSK